MGSCSCYSKTRAIKTIKPLSDLGGPPPGQQVNHQKTKSDILGLQVDSKINDSDLTPSRKNHKILTVLPVPEDENEFLSGFPIIKAISEGKSVQGSLVVQNPITIGGSPSTNIQSNFEEKLFYIEGENFQKEFLLEHDLWVCCKKGLKPESPNQDDFTIVLKQDSLILGVFDGHGVHGHEVSNYVHNELPRLLLRHKSWKENPLASYKDCFNELQSNLIFYCNNPINKFDCVMSGCTSTLITIRPNKLYIGYVGDSRSVLGKKTGDEYTAKDLTIDHKPSTTAERHRIERMGGQVRKDDGDLCHRVFVKNKNFPGIAMSRTLGDSLAQTIGVTCDPETLEVNLDANDEFVLICSDGVWEFISSQEAVEIVSKINDIKEASETLAKIAWERWIKYESNVVDDITVILVNLKKYKS